MNCHPQLFVQNPDKDCVGNLPPAGCAASILHTAGPRSVLSHPDPAEGWTEGRTEQGLLCRSCCGSESAAQTHICYKHLLIHYHSPSEQSGSQVIAIQLPVEKSDLLYQLKLNVSYLVSCKVCDIMVCWFFQTL